MHSDVEMGIEPISFLPEGMQPGDVPASKISRGEERIFIWHFFLAMMEIEDWAERRFSLLFIYDLVSSLDDHNINIFVTASTLYDLIETHLGERKIIVATHHFGLFSILFNWLKKGENRDTFREGAKASILSGKRGAVSLETHKSDVFLYHLRVLQLLKQAQKKDNVRAYHLASFTKCWRACRRFSVSLEFIGLEDADEIIRIVNTLVNKNIYYYESDLLVPDNRALFDEILQKLDTHYKFVTHVG